MEDKLYLENLDEEILQLNKVVTYKWIVHNLKVPTNVAKQMLFEFVENQKQAGVKLNATYFVSGLKQINGILGHEVCVVPESKLDETKASFSTLTSLHLYSVSKADLTDVGDLYALDYDISDISTKLFGISCVEATLRKEIVPREHETSVAAGVTTDKRQVEVKQSTAKKEPAVARKNADNKSPPDVKKTKQSKNSGIASMFQNKESSKSSKTSSDKSKPENIDSVTKAEPTSQSISAKTDKKFPVGNSKKTTCKSSGIATMFKSMASKESSKSSSKESKLNGKEAEVSPRTDTSEKSEPEIKMEESKGSLRPATNKTHKKVDTSNVGKTKPTPAGNAKRKAADDLEDKRKRRNVASDDFQKRRKRIIVVSESSEDEDIADSESPVPSPRSRRRVIEESSDDEDPIPPTPVAPASELTLIGRRKRKLVPHTVVDKEGYIVTQNRYEDVSASEEGSADENEEPTGTGNHVSDKVAANIKAKSAPALLKPEKTEAAVVKNKQATMMSFFKKK